MSKVLRKSNTWIATNFLIKKRVCSIFTNTRNRFPERVCFKVHRIENRLVAKHPLSNKSSRVKKMSAYPQVMFRFVYIYIWMQPYYNNEADGE